jgi:hypothetical protein
MTTTEETVILQLTDTLRISRSDELNLHLEELRTVVSHASRWQSETKETEKWVQCGYFGTVGLAVNKALELSQMNLVSDSEIRTIEEFLNELKAIKAQMEKSVSDFAIHIDSFPHVKSKRGRKAKNPSEEDE